MPNRKINVSCNTTYQVMSIHRTSHWKHHLVYVLKADKPIRYPMDRSKIAYIGETSSGKRRPAGSAASKAERSFGKLHGVRRLDVHIVTCKGKQRVKTWEELERGLLATFLELFGRLPKYNKQCRKLKTSDVRLFSKSRLRSIVKGLS